MATINKSIETELDAVGQIGKIDFQLNSLPVKFLFYIDEVEGLGILNIQIKNIELPAIQRLSDRVFDSYGLDIPSTIILNNEMAGG